MGKVFQSVIVLLLALASVTASAGASTQSAEQLLRSGRIDDALAIIQQRIASKSNDAEAYNLLSRAHYALNNYDQSIKAGEKAVSLAPGNATYHLWLGRAYGRKAEHANWWSAASLAGKMRDEFERSVQLNGDDVDARTDLAEFYIEAPGIVGGGKDKAESQAKAVEMRDSAAPPSQRVTLGPWPAASSVEAGLLHIGKSYSVHAVALDASTSVQLGTSEPGTAITPTEFVTTVNVLCKPPSP